MIFEVCNFCAKKEGSGDIEIEAHMFSIFLSMTF